jgi:hypothetical protein
MNPDTSPLMWLDAYETLDVSELARASGMDATALHELVAYGALAPLGSTQAEWRFSAACVMPLRAAGRLQRDFDLDLSAISVLLVYMDRIEVLEEHIRTLRSQRP